MAALVAFNQRHFRPIDRNHHARGVGVDFNWDAPQLIGLAEGVDDVELPQFFRRHLDQLGVGVVVGLPVPQEGLANALVDGVDRNSSVMARFSQSWTQLLGVRLGTVESAARSGHIGVRNEQRLLTVSS